jgi:hypothetical protein
MSDHVSEGRPFQDVICPPQLHCPICYPHLQQAPSEDEPSEPTPPPLKVTQQANGKIYIGIVETEQGKRWTRDLLGAFQCVEDANNSLKAAANQYTEITGWTFTEDPDGCLALYAAKGTGNTDV